MKNAITYHYRGAIERGTGAPGYVWHDGYSEDGENGGALYPWQTKAECHHDAKVRGGVAKFARPGAYQPKTGQPCHCKPGQHRDNCPDCEGTGQRIDFAAIRARRVQPSYGGTD